MSKWNWKELKTYNTKQKVFILLAVIFWVAPEFTQQLWPYANIVYFLAFLSIASIYLFQD